MEAKESDREDVDAKGEASGAKAADAAPVAPALRLVAKHFHGLRADLGDAADEFDGIECLRPAIWSIRSRGELDTRSVERSRFKSANMLLRLGTLAAPLLAAVSMQGSDSCCVTD